MTPETIPAELRDDPHWVVWRWIERDGRRTKPPFDPRTDRPGDATDRNLWMPFERALSLLPRYDGVGWAVTQDSPYSGVDLDHCISEDGTLAAWALEIVRRLDSYTEYTPSGVGLRVWCRGKLPEGRRRKGPVEMYDRGRYFTVTGERFEHSRREIMERTAELAALHADLFKEEVKQPRIFRPDPLSLSDDEVLRKAFQAKNGPALQALMEGDLSAHGGDQSAADLALCSHLAFWFRGDAQAIDRVFRRSGLMRAKWERADYRAATIRKALEQPSYYDPVRSNGHANGNGTPPAAADPKPPAAQDEADPTNQTDLGNAIRFVAKYGHKVRYCPPHKAWYIWDGKRWAEDRGCGAEALANTIPKVIWQEARDAADVGDFDLAKALTKWSLASESQGHLDSMLKVARSQPGIPVFPEDLDRDPWLLNVANGTLDLRTGELRPHNRGDLVTKIAPVAFDPSIQTPMFEKFLRQIMRDDFELIGFVQRVLGYALTGDISEHALFFLHGTGRNGKSTLLNVVQEIMGDYATSIDANVLMAKRQEEHPTALTDLDGRRFIPTVEVEDGKRLAESLVKKMTGGDKIKARRMRQDFYEFTPTHKIFLAANHRPSVRGTDEAIWSRILLIPFEVTVPKEDRIKNLDRKLVAQEGPGILAWLVDGCLAWQRGGLNPPESVTAALGEYREAEDNIQAFLTDACQVHRLPSGQLDPDKSKRVSARDLYSCYRSRAEFLGERPMSAKKLGLELKAHGMQTIACNGTYYVGLTLRTNNQWSAI